MEETHKRTFTGIFIPVEVLDDPRLSGTDKLLLAEIDALRGENNEGCYASNAYLGKVVGVSAVRAKDIITKLRQLGYVETISFDGRHRRLRTSLHHKLADGLFSSQQTAWEQEGRQLESKPIDTRRDTSKPKYPCPLVGTEDAWEEWLQFKKEKRNSMTPTTYKRQAAFLKRLGPEKARAALEQSMANGWTGLFEPRADRAPLPEQLSRLSDRELSKRRAALIEQRNIIFREYGKQPQGAVREKKVKLWKEQEAIEAEQQKRQQRSNKQ